MPGPALAPPAIFAAREASTSRYLLCAVARLSSSARRGSFVRRKLLSFFFGHRRRPPLDHGAPMPGRMSVSRGGLRTCPGAIWEKSVFARKPPRRCWAFVVGFGYRNMIQARPRGAQFFPPLGAPPTPLPHLVECAGDVVFQF